MIDLLVLTGLFIEIIGFKNEAFMIFKIKESIDTMEKFINSFKMPKDPWSGHDHFTQQIVWSNNVKNIFKLEEPEKF